MNVPQGVATVTAEGGDLKMAIGMAAEQLGLHPAQIDYKLDLSHFRNASGGSVARTTVRILAWSSGRDAPTDGAEPPRVDGILRGAARPERVEARPPRPPREARDRPERTEERRPERTEERPRGDDDDRGRRRKRTTREGGGETNGAGRAREAREPREDGGREGGRDKPETLRGAEAGSTEASDFAQVWFAKLLELMGVQGTTVASGSSERVHLAVKADRAGRIVGKRGATLGSIRHLLGLALEQRFGALTIDVDVGDDRPPQEREARDRDRGDRDRPERGDRGDRGDRGGRDRDRDRGGQRGRGRDRAGAERGRYPEEKLRALARRAAEKARDGGQTITINLELNSFDRRIVHLEVSQMDGVESQSEERTGEDGRLVKYVQIIPVKD